MLISASMITALFVVVLAGTASARLSKGQQNAVAAASEAVNGYLAGTRSAGLCDAQAKTEWLAKMTIFRDSCTAANGFTFVTYDAATPTAFKSSAPFNEVKRELVPLCAQGGTVLSSGVKNKFLDFFAGVGNGVGSVPIAEQIADVSLNGVHGAFTQKIC
jgi:hypothetical protein